MTQPLFLWQGQLPYGTEYWLTPEAEPALFRQDFAKMRAMGFNVARIFVSQNETAPGTFDFEQLDLLFDAAAADGIGLCPTFTLGLRPWRAERIGLNPALGIPLPYLLDDPAYRSELAEPLKALVARYRSHSAIWSWILWNEPRRSVDFFPPPAPTFAKFRQWLRNTYGDDIVALNGIWYPEQRRHHLTDFEQIEPETIVPTWQGVWSEDLPYHTRLTRYELLSLGQSASAGQGWSNYGALRDWLRFNVDALTDSIRWLGEMTSAIDPDHPTHINPDGFLQSQVAAGRNLRELAQTVGVWGSSLHPAHHFSYIDAEAQFPDAYAYYVKAIASANKEGMSIITELQGGPNTWSGNKNFTPDDTDLVHWNLAALGAGLKGVIYWLWRPRPHGWEAGEWGLLHRDGRPTTRTEAAALVGHFLQDNVDWLAALQPVPAQVAILRSSETEALSFIEGLRAHLPVAKYQTLSEYGCFRALWRHGISADFVDESEVQSGILSRYKCLFIPYAEALGEKTSAAIASFVREGGWAYGETPLAMKTPVGFAYARFPGGHLESIFPSALDTWPAKKAPTLMTSEGAVPTELFVQPLLALEGDLEVARARDYPGVIEREVGRGRSCYVGTALTLHVGTRVAAPEAEAFLARFAGRAGVDPLWTTDGDAVVYLLLGEICDGLIAINFDAESRTVTTRLPRTYRDAVVVLGAADISRRETTVVLTLPPGEGLVIKLTH
jgi:beta-galactosidase GanA